MTAAPVVQRIVPGAPPSIELSKSQRKKKKATKAGDIQSPVSAEAAHEHPETSESAPGLVSRAESQAPQMSEEDSSLKPSPIVDLMNKRLKAMTKKIARVSTYAATDIEKLNDDQVRSLKNLPTLEAIQKEVAEVKKAIETLEHEIAQDSAVKRLQAEKADKARISNAVSDAESSLFTRFNDVLDVLRVHSLLTSGAIDISSLADPSEVSALLSISDILIGGHDRNQSIVQQIVRGVGDFEGTSYTRLLAITQQALNPPQSPSPVPEESVDDEEQAPPSIDEVEEDQPPVTGILNVTNSMTGSFQFIQQSELEAASLEGGSEWVDAAVHAPEAEGVAEDAEPATATSVAPESGTPIDWAADEEGGLPSIAGLQAEFGNSGSVTPAEAEKAPPQEEAAETSWHAYGEPNVNGDAAVVEVDNDGFTQTKGRPRGRGAFRGERVPRGGRGGERGAPRGGDRGPRGGRGDRGGFRGGRGGSEWRDGERAREGHGEWGGDRDRGFGTDGERGDGDHHRGRGGGYRARGDGGRARGEGGRARGRRGGRGDRGGHHQEASPAPA